MSEGDMTHGERLTYSREMPRASSERDRCLAQLGLDKVDAAGVFDAIYDEGKSNGQQVSGERDTPTDAPATGSNGRDADGSTRPATPTVVPVGE